MTSVNQELDDDILTSLSLTEQFHQDHDSLHRALHRIIARVGNISDNFYTYKPWFSSRDLPGMLVFKRRCLAGRKRNGKTK